jgi:hypothetical protein
VVGINDLRSDPTYIKVYINWASNLVVSVLPLTSLVVLNYLVHKHLVMRRNEIYKTFDSMSKRFVGAQYYLKNYHFSYF